MTTRSAWAEKNISRTTGKQIGWTARWVLPNGEEGYETGARQPSGRFKTRQAAIDYGREQIDAYRKGIYVPERRGQTTLAEAMDDWWQVKVTKRSAATRHTYGAAKRAVLREWGGWPMAELVNEGPRLHAWLDDILARGQSRSHMKSRHTVLSQTFDHAMKRTPPIVMANPMRVPRETDQRSERELSRARGGDVTGENLPDYRDWMLMAGALRPLGQLVAEIGPLTGMRVGELLGLRLRPHEDNPLLHSYVDFLGRMIVVRSQTDMNGDTRALTKSTAGERIIPVDEYVLDAINAHVAEHGLGPDGLLFRHTYGGVIRDHAFQEWWRQARQATGFSYEARAMRRFYRTRLELAGVPKPLVEMCLGHTLPGLDSNYFRLDQTGQALVRDALAVLRGESSRHRRGIGAVGSL